MTSKEGVEEMELKEVVVAVFVLFLIVALLLFVKSGTLRQTDFFAAILIYHLKSINK